MTHNQKLQLRLLVADHAPTRLGIQIALDGEIEACAEASSADEAIRAAMNEQPDGAEPALSAKPRNGTVT